MISEVIPFSLLLFSFIPFLSHTVERGWLLSSLPFISIPTQRHNMAKESEAKASKRVGCLFITHFVFLFFLRGYDGGMGKRHNNVINAKPEFPFLVGG